MIYYLRVYMRAVNIIIKIVVYSYIEDIGFCVTYFIALEMFHEFLFKSFFLYLFDICMIEKLISIDFRNSILIYK